MKDKRKEQTKDRETKGQTGAEADRTEAYAALNQLRHQESCFKWPRRPGGKWGGGERTEMRNVEAKNNSGLRR